MKFKMFFFLSILFIFNYSCKDDEPCPDCTIAFTCMEGVCTCPPEKIEIGDDCRVLGEGEYFGEGVGSDCAMCDFESLIVWTHVDENGIASYGLDNGFTSTSSVDIDYFELDSGDSIFIKKTPLDLTSPGCKYNDKLIFMSGEGKYSQDKELLNLCFKYYPQGESTSIGSCSFVFRK